MATVACPHCGAVNEQLARFCAGCGKAVPGGSKGPRMVSADQRMSSGAASLLGDELRKRSRRAATALLVVAILQTLGVVIFYFLLRGNPDFDQAEVTAGLLVIGAAAAVFYGLFFWARRNPLPAAIVGLVLYVSLQLLDAVADPASIMRGILIKLIIIFMLVRAIQAGLEYRKLQAQQGGA